MSAKYGIGKIVAHDRGVYVGVDAAPSVGDLALVVANTCHHGFDLGSVISVRAHDGGGYIHSYDAKARCRWGLCPPDYVTLKPAAAGSSVKHGGNDYTLAKRAARVGETILITETIVRVMDEFYKVGDVGVVVISKSCVIKAEFSDGAAWVGHTAHDRNRYMVLEPAHREFVAGDIVTGLPNNDYGITNRSAIMRVVRGVDSFGDIRVKVLDHATKPWAVGEVHGVKPYKFELVTNYTPKSTCPFKVGDKVVGTPSNTYGYTNADAVMEVTRVYDGYIDVKMLSHTKYPDTVGVAFTYLRASDFVLAPKPTPGFAKGDQVRVKTSRSIRGNPIDTSIPWTVVDYDVSDEVHIRNSDGQHRFVRESDLQRWVEPTPQPKFSRGDKIRCNVSRSRYGARIDTSVPHTFYTYEGRHDVCIRTNEGDFRSVALTDIEPWVDADTSATSQTLADMAQFATALSAFTDAATALQSAAAKLGASV